MVTRTPVEVTTRYATTVNTLAEAWAFVMDHVDRVGDDPRIEILPVWTITEDDEPPRYFSVVVSGMVEDE